MARPAHKQVHATCEYGATTWAACDAARNVAYKDWQAMQYVILAFNIVVKAGGTCPTAYRKDQTLFPQLVQLIAGEREDLTDSKGNPWRTEDPKRVLDAIERFKAGDLPAYNLYEPVMPAAA